MEIPVIARMSDFDAGILSFATANTSPITRLVGLSTFKWGALILAIIYAFGRIARRIEIFVLQRHGRAKSDRDNDDVISSDEGEEDEDEDEEDSRESCSSEDEVRDESLGGFFEEFRVAGQKRKFSIHRRRDAGPTLKPNHTPLYGGFKPSMWDNLYLNNSTRIFAGEFSDGNGVVKLWDGLGLDVGFGCSEDFISVVDLDRNLVVGSVIGRSSVVSPSSPRVVVAAGGGGDGKVGVRSWDMRLRRRTPAVAAEWRFDGQPEVTAAGEGVYVRDGVSGNVTVGDFRKANSPLVDGWFDADGVREMGEE